MQWNNAVCAAMALLALGSVVRADDETPKRSFFQVGVSRIVDTDFRDHISDVGFTLGAGYVLANPLLVKQQGVRESVDVDYNRSSGNGSRLTTLGVTYAVRVPFTPGGAAINQPYYGAGLGVFRPELKYPAVDGEGGYPAGTSRKTHVGGKVIVGVNLQSNTFAELAWVISGGVDDPSTKSDTLNFAVGIRY